MRDLLLHIGRHKSGTTAIQRFLNANVRALANAGFYVPRTGREDEGHHMLARPLQRGPARRSGLRDPLGLPVYRELLAELEDPAPDLTAVISSEAFQNCEPRLVKRGFAGFAVRIVVYLRNQVDYLASAYAQRVHATGYSGDLETYYREIYLSQSDYRRFLCDWESQYPGRLTVRRYVASIMVEDFCRHALGLDVGDWAMPRAANPSLNARVVLFKRRLNEQGASGDLPPKALLYHLLPRLNGYFPGPGFTVPEAVRRDLVERCRDTDRVVAREYFGERELFDYDRASPDPQPLLSDDEFDDMLAVLKELALCA